MTLVFVYGSLLEGEGNHHILERARFVGASRTAPVFRMVDLGYFPGVVAGGKSAVLGEVYEVDAETLDRLDRLEGHPSFYRRTPVTLACGSLVEIYLLRPSQVEGRPVVSSGSWRKHERNMR